MKKIIIDKATLDCPICGSKNSIRVGDRWIDGIMDPKTAVYGRAVSFPMVMGRGDNPPIEASFMRYHCLECNTRFRESSELLVTKVSEEELRDWVGEDEYEKTVSQPSDRKFYYVCPKCGNKSSVEPYCLECGARFDPELARRPYYEK